MKHLLRMLVPMMALLIAGSLFAAGCGKTTGASAGASKDSSTVVTESSPEETRLEESISDVEEKTSEEKSAACEALRYVKEANTGSVFEASTVKACGGWARVAVVQTEVPEDEAVSFGVFLRKTDSGTWEVTETGTDITVENLPGAPEEIFETD